MFIALAWCAQPASPDLLRQGQVAFRRQNWPAAERLFSDFLRSHPSSPLGYKWLGMAYVAQQKYLPSEPLFQKACHIAPNEQDVCYYWARTLYTLSRFDDALRIYRQALALTPRNGRVLLGIALTLEALSRDSEAAQYYDRAIAAGDKNAPSDYERFRRKRAASPSPTAAIRFEPKDLPFTVRNGATPAKHLPETMLAGIAVLDFDGDGWPDLYIANGAAFPSLDKSKFSNALLRNNHDGTFTDVTAKAGVAGSGYSMGVAAADFDNDGFPDLFVTGLRSNHLYRNRGDGTFDDITARAGVGGDGQWSVAAAWFDYDNDGLLDLFVVRYVQWDPAAEPYCGPATYRQYCTPKLYTPLTNLLYRNLGNGKFQDVSAESGISAHAGKGMGVAIGDFDSDGNLDVFVANDTMPNFLFRNRGDGRFEERALSAGVAYNENGVPVSSMGVEFRDYDNDGREDLFITALSNETFTLFHNTGNGFEDRTLASGLAKPTLPFTGWSNVMADFNNDGWKDLFTANGHVMDNAELSSGRQSRQPNLLLPNGRSAFSSLTLPGPAFHRGLAVADFDRDGRLDLALTRLNQPAQILWNRTDPPANWIAFDLRGRRSNRDAIGAWVEIETPSGKQFNRVTSASGYGATSSRLLHFGLAAGTSVSTVRVRWPSGLTQTLQNLPANRLHPVIEP